MKKMTMTLTMIVLAFTLSTMALGQTVKRNKSGNSATQRSITKAREVPGTNRQDFDRGYLSPYASSRQTTGRQLCSLCQPFGSNYKGTTTVNQGTLNNLTKPGNNTIKSANVPPRNKADGSYSFNVGPNIQDRNRAAQPNHFASTINWGDGTSTTASAQRQSAKGFTPPFPTARLTTNARPNAARLSGRANNGYYSTKLNDLLVSGYSKPKSNLTATTYGRGSFANTRGQ